MVAAKEKSYVLKLGQYCIFIGAHGTEEFEVEHLLSKCIYLKSVMFQKEIKMAYKDSSSIAREHKLKGGKNGWVTICIYELI